MVTLYGQMLMLSGGSIVTLSCGGNTGYMVGCMVTRRRGGTWLYGDMFAVNGADR